MSQSFNTAGGAEDPDNRSGGGQAMVASQPELIQVREPRFGFEAIGGMDQLKAWLGRLRTAIGSPSPPHGMRASRGVILLGAPGSGRRTCAEAMARYLGRKLVHVSLLRTLDGPASGGRTLMHRVLDVAGESGRTLVLLENLDGFFEFVAARAATSWAFNDFLRWFDCLREREHVPLVVATAAKWEFLPPEVCKPARFEMFWIEPPTRGKEN